MRFFHISDIHLGKRLNDIDLLEDQSDFLDQFLQAVRSQRPDAVVIAGDIYDRSIPSADAVVVLDRFLTELSELGICTMLISGNHDSAERLSFASGMLSSKGIHICTSQGEIKKVVMEDMYGRINFYLMPFTRPSNLKNDDEEQIQDYDAMARGMLDKACIDYTERNVLVSHQLYVGAGSEPERSDSETVSIGGTDGIDTSIIERFDYAALGHLHRKQRTGAKNAMYCGSPVKYSLSEYNHCKCWLDVNIGQKGNVAVEEIHIKLRRDLRRLKGRLEDLLAAEEYSEDLIWAVLTDETPVTEALARLRSVYPNTLHIEYETKAARQRTPATEIKTKNSAQIFGEFYQYMLGKDMNEEQSVYIERVIDMMNEEGGYEAN